jgi:hypothetical protein
VISQALLGRADGCKSRITKGFHFSALLRVAPYCVPGIVRVVSNRVQITAPHAHPNLGEVPLHHTFVTMPIDSYAHALPSIGGQMVLAMDAVLS